MKTLVSISLLHQHKLNRKIQKLISKQLRKKANNKIKTNKQTNSTFIHWALDWLLGRILELKLDPDPDQSYNIEIVKRLSLYSLNLTGFLKMNSVKSEVLTFADWLYST